MPRQVYVQHLCLPSRLCYTPLDMKTFLLTKVRLTAYYPIFFIAFLIIILATPKIALSGGQLTLLTVNSFLLAFYLGPIMAGQKQRLDDLAKVIRSEAIAFFNFAIQSQDMVPEVKRDVKSMSKKYLEACVHSRKVAEGEREYEALLRYCIDYKGKSQEKVDKAQQILVDNQQNRSQLSAQLQNNVYSHEWFVLMVLSIITLAYIVVIDYGHNVLLNGVAALLCTGLALLLLILEKLNSLTHKKAKPIWKPFEKLLDTDFKRID
jgi:hypothetical protein